MIEKVIIPGALVTKGHYSTAVKDEQYMYISGQLPINPFTGEKCQGTIKEQTKQVLDNFNYILKATKVEKENVLKMVIYIADISLWDEVNKIMGDFFGNHYPARSIVPVKELHYGFLIEAEGIVKL